MYQLTQCCCCISLRIGSLIIGLLYLVGSVISLASFTVMVVEIYAKNYQFSFYEFTPPEIKAIIANHEGGYRFSILSEERYDSNSRIPPPIHCCREVDRQGLVTAHAVIGITLLLLCCVQIVIDILLIIGAAKRRADLAVPWLVLNVVMFIFNIGGFCAISIIGFMYFHPASMHAIAPLVLSVVYSAFTVYVMLVVNSFHENFKKLY